MARMWDLDDLASCSEIARTLGLGMPAVSQWATRYDDFPKPIVMLGKIPVYSWAQVRDWYNTKQWKRIKGH